MPFLVNTQTGKPEYVPDKQVQAAVESGSYRFAEGAKLASTDELTGLEQLAAPEDIASGELSLMPDQRALERDRSIEYGNSPVTATLLGIGRGASIGLTDMLAEGLGYGFEVDQYAVQNPTASTAGELVGAIAPAFIPGGQYTAAGALARGSNAIIRGGAGAGRLARAGRVAAAGALEGGAFGAGLSLGEQVRRGEDFQAAASQALSDGLMGAGYGALGGLAFEFGGQALTRITQPLQRRRAAASVLEDFDFQLDDIRRTVDEAMGTQRTLAKDTATLKATQDELASLMKSGADEATVAAKQLELQRLTDKLNEAKSSLKPGGLDKARKAIMKQAEEAREVIYADLRDNVLAIRGAGDHVNSFAKLVEESAGGFFTPETRKAVSRYRAAQQEFDDFFRKSGPKSTSGKGLQEKKVTSKKAGSRAKLENVGDVDIIGSFTANTRESMKVARKLDVAGLEMAKRLVDDGGMYGVKLQIPDGARGISEVLYEGAQDIDDIVAKAMDAAESSAKDRALSVTDEAAEQAFKDISEARNKAVREVSDAKDRVKKVERSQAEIDRLKERIRKNQERLENREALLANAEEGKRYAKELEDLAKEAGIFGEGGISKADLAIAALDLGIVDSPELEWAARIHLVAKMFGKPGASGILNRIAQLPVARTIRGAAEAALPGANSPIGRAVRGLGLDKAMEKLKGVGSKLAPKTVAKKTIRMGEARQAFEQRLDKAMRRFAAPGKALKRAAIVAPHTTLAKVSFAPIAHSGDSDLDPDTRAYERRAKELESVAMDPEQLLGMLQSRIQGRTIADPEMVDGMAAELTRTMYWLHSKLPPRRSLGPDTERRNSSPREIEKFSRYVRYALDHGAVLDDFASGTLGPEGPETLRETAPALYDRIRVRLVQESQEREIPREQRLYAGTLFSLPQLDSSLRSDFRASLAATNAPTQITPPQPQGSLNISNPRTATERVAER